MVTIERIIEKAKTYLPSLDEHRVRRAYSFALEAHKGQKRFSGEPYIIHPLSVADILLEFHPDEDTIISALLHDVAEDTARTIEDIELIFGKTVGSLCWGMVKLSKVRSKLNDPHVENLRKLFLAMAQDFRVVLLKLCDRLHNMSTLQHVRPEKRRRIAQETINIYAPIAARLGIYRLKSQLEDLCFMYLQPQEYKTLTQELNKTGKGRDKFIIQAKKIILEVLAKEGIQAHVDGRLKSIYSIYRKMQKKNKTSISEIFDVFAMRVILPDIYKYDKEYTGHLYTALGVIHNYFTPLAHRFKDYIAVPKVNGYRSLHTTVIGLGPKAYTQPTEIQLRTESMHQSSEFGVAAHWIYDESGSGTTAHGLHEENLAVAPHKEWLTALQKVQKETKNNQELLENLRVDIFQDRILVLTPRGDVRDLPAGATPIDFAYAVHTEIGNHCVGAKVNGTIVPVNHELKSGEVVEIITRNNARPSQSWLTFTKTNHARNRIRSWFRNQHDNKHFKEGKLILNEKLLQLGKPLLDVNLSILKQYDGKKLTVNEREEILVELGKGVLFPSTVLKKIFSLEELLEHAEPRNIKKKAVTATLAEPEVIIGGQKNMPYHFVKCCSAQLSDPLVGYVTRGKGVSLHKKNCLVLRNSGRSRLVTVRVNMPNNKYLVHIKVVAEDRLGLMRDISHSIAETAVNIFDLSQEKPTKGNRELHFTLEINHFDQLERVLSNLEKIPSVRRAFKVN